MYPMAAYLQLSRNAPIGRLVSPEAEVEVRLEPGQVFTLNGDRRGLRIICKQGRLWVTQTADPCDYALGPGEQFRISRAGTVVIQGLPGGEIRIAA